MMKIKHPNGYGSIVYLGKRRRNPYAIRVTDGWEEAIATKGPKKGQPILRQKYRYISYHKTKSEAKTALAMHHVSPVSPRANITLQDLYDEWSEAKYEKISKSTRDNYRAAWKYLSSHAKVKLKELRKAHIQEVIDRCYKAGMSKSSLQKVRTLAVMLCDHALSEDIIRKNYAKLVDMPRIQDKKKGRFSDLDVKKLWNNLDVPWVDTILIMIYTGMRPGEMLGLTRFSVDWDTKIITGGIKTDAGTDRLIPIHPKIVPLIKRWYDKGSDYLISSVNGNRIAVDNYRSRYYYPALEKMGLPKLSPHGCRHTFASMMSDAEVGTKEIQEIIGHAKYETTATIYTHKDIEKLTKAIEKI